MQDYYFNEKEYIFFDNSFLNKDQLDLINQPTPQEHILNRDDGLKSVTGFYVKKQLNYLFGLNYDFQIVYQEFIQGSKEVIVHGRLVLRTPKGTVTKEQFGSSKVELSNVNNGSISITAPVNIGNAFKSAATDALKKCASEIGICWDVYSQQSPENIITQSNNAQPLNYSEESLGKRIKQFLSNANTIEEFEKIKHDFCDNVKITDYLQNIIDTEFDNFNLRTNE